MEECLEDATKSHIKCKSTNVDKFPVILLHTNPHDSSASSVQYVLNSLLGNCLKFEALTPDL